MTQAFIICRPIRHLIFLLGNLVPPSGIERVRHRRNPDQETENNPLNISRRVIHATTPFSMNSPSATGKCLHAQARARLILAVDANVGKLIASSIVYSRAGLPSDSDSCHLPVLVREYIIVVHLAQHGYVRLDAVVPIWREVFSEVDGAE
ncbi:hypothetical protein [Sinorhizobium medicae]